MSRADEFYNIANSITKLNRDYEAGALKHMQWSEKYDKIFAEYGWSKEEFLKELNIRLGLTKKEDRQVAKNNKKK